MEELLAETDSACLQGYLAHEKQRQGYLAHKKQCADTLLRKQFSHKRGDLSFRGPWVFGGLGSLGNLNLDDYFPPGLR